MTWPASMLILANERARRRADDRADRLVESHARRAKIVDRHREAERVRMAGTIVPVQPHCPPAPAERSIWWHLDLWECMRADIDRQCALTATRPTEAEQLPYGRRPPSGWAELMHDYQAEEPPIHFYRSRRRS